MIQDPPKIVRYKALLRERCGEPETLFAPNVPAEFVDLMAQKRISEFDLSPEKIGSLGEPGADYLLGLVRAEMLQPLVMLADAAFDEFMSKKGAGAPWAGRDVDGGLVWAALLRKDLSDKPGKKWQSRASYAAARQLGVREINLAQTAKKIRDTQKSLRARWYRIVRELDATHHQHIRALADALWYIQRIIDETEGRELDPLPTDMEARARGWTNIVRMLLVASNGRPPEHVTDDGGDGEVVAA